MIEEVYVEALATMRERGWSLVLLGERWYFAKLAADTPGSATVGVIRLGHWATPEEALAHLATQGMRNC